MTTQRIQHFEGPQCSGKGYLGRTEGYHGSPFFQKKILIFPIISLSFMQTNSGVPNAAPRRSRPEISFCFILISNLSKSTMDHSSNLLTPTWRPRSGPNWHKRSQDLRRLASEPTRTPSSRYQVELKVWLTKLFRIDILTTGNKALREGQLQKLLHFRRLRIVLNKMISISFFMTQRTKTDWLQILKTTVLIL